MKLRRIEALDERYGPDPGAFYLTGLQTLVKLLLLQGESDARAGLNTAGFVSGYRGSPLAGLDQELWGARPFLERARIHFQPGLNEDLAATSVWGSQQLNLFPGSRYDGVFGLWYGKGPGVDRSGDVFKHANSAGTARHGGVLAVAGDDHICKSSTLPHQSEYSFIDARIPVLNPSDLGDVLDMGLKGYALSRFSGCWIALKLTEEHADASQTVRIPALPRIVHPEYEFPGGGVHIRWPDAPTAQEDRLQNHKLPAALAFARANDLNRVVIDSRRPRLGIVATGKAWMDVRQALDELGIGRRRAAELGIRLFKVGMSWPLESGQAGEFAAGLEEVLVIEEKRGIIESQLKEQLYHRSAADRPRILGKSDERGRPFLSAVEEFTPLSVAAAIGRRLLQFGPDREIARRLTRIERETGAPPGATPLGGTPQREAARLGAPQEQTPSGTPQERLPGRTPHGGAPQDRAPQTSVPRDRASPGGTPQREAARVGAPQEQTPSGTPQERFPGKTPHGGAPQDRAPQTSVPRDRASLDDAPPGGAPQDEAATPSRQPHFCSGCPHNTSTRVPDDSIAIAGIGCHYMATWMDDRDTRMPTQMGGEGAVWIGLAPFTGTPHVFQNLGDGTYAHSGLLAIRAAIAAGIDITYKILFNDAVAMTGGQAVEGGLTVERIARQLAAEGVERIVVVTDRPADYPRKRLPAGVTVRHRGKLDRVQRELRKQPGVSALIYAQTCAAELRRRRRRGQARQPDRWVAIHPLVCEGCGDCNAVSNCLSVIPLETEFGRKRAINQSACNKDYRCLDGFCPSFVTLEGVRLAKPSPRLDSMPSPPTPASADPSLCNVLIAGIGGTGVGTVAAILGLAAHLEGRRVMALDQTGLAQKFGAVVSHVRIGASAKHLRCMQIPAARTDVLLAADLIVASGRDILARLAPDRTRAVVNMHEEMPAGFIHDPDFGFASRAMLASLAKATRSSDLIAVDATGLATALLGDAIAANVFLLGVAFQRGLLPVSEAAIVRAIELRGVAVDGNVRAFAWGRHAAADPAAVRQRAAQASAPMSAGAPTSAGTAAPTSGTPKPPGTPAGTPPGTPEPAGIPIRPGAPARIGFPAPTGTPASPPATLDDLVARRARFLGAYQDAAYAERYRSRVDRVRAAERRIAPDSTRLTEAVARGYFKLLAYKDEYEVARLFAQTDFLAGIQSQFEGRAKLGFHLSPPLLARPDPVTGRPRKYAFGAWMLPVFGVLARLRRLRGTPLDLFGYSRERRAERRLIVAYEALLSRIVTELDAPRLDLAVELAALPERIRGYGPIKAAAIERAATIEKGLLDAWAARASAPDDRSRSEAA